MSDKLDIARFHLHYPSVRQHGLYRKVNAGKFVKWIQTPEGSLEMASTCISSIIWMQQPGLPAHEYLIIHFGPGPSSWPLRVERDTDSWTTLFRPKSRSNCKDTINFRPPISFESDIQLASVTFTDRHGPTLGHLADLLQIVSESADYYNVWTLNCWWFASCIWTNLVRSVGSEVKHSFCNPDVVRHWNTVSAEGNDIWGMEPVKTARVLQFIHVAGLQRALGDW
ncbi:hypothetical protein JAAARDRAFT_36604 [Jaapia argillacea MUCL 33604]|uniref:Uncharacterized protein n=1 Tax=Jaapia argillacea MUCL 33604 TaxID=933084 RepID=A0A067PNS2_9AGAM|nr:hypothetical protein JAAARDRAFT_36604 [Jaapia argillacea MUCL 33604]